MIGFILGPDRNSGSGPLPYPFRWNLGWYRFRLGTGRFGRYQTGTAIFFHVVFRFYDELPVSRAPSSSLAGSRAPLQFPDCITCSPPVPWLYHMLPSSSQTVSRATLEFTKCIMSPPPPPPPPPPFGDTWRGILSLFSPFVTNCFLPRRGIKYMIIIIYYY